MELIGNGLSWERDGCRRTRSGRGDRPSSECRAIHRVRHEVDRRGSVGSHRPHPTPGHARGTGCGRAACRVLVGARAVVTWFSCV